MAGYAELHCHSNFSFLDGATHPEDLALAGAAKGLHALAITDHGGLYGMVRFDASARKNGLRPLIGCELTVEQVPGIPTPDPGLLVDPLATAAMRTAERGRHHLTLLVRNATGYRNLCRLLSLANLGGRKGHAAPSAEMLADHAGGLVALSGCKRFGLVPRLLRAGRAEEAAVAATRLRELFDAGNFHLEMQNHLLPDDPWLTAELAELGRRLEIPCVASNDVHILSPETKPLQDVLVSIRERATLDDADARGLLAPNAERYLKTREEMEDALIGPRGRGGRAIIGMEPWLWRAYMESLDRTVEIADRCDFSLDLRSKRFPGFDVPAGETPFSVLYQLCQEGACRKYHPITSAVSRRLQTELEVIEKTGLAEFFLINHDLMSFAKKNAIPGQGRGSAADSIVAYLLDITRVDPVEHKLLFERFLHEEQTSTPDIDIDFASSRREEVIRYIYQRYGEERTGMVANVVTFRPRLAIREVGKVMGFTAATIDRLAKSADSWYPEEAMVQVRQAGIPGPPQAAPPATRGRPAKPGPERPPVPGTELVDVAFAGVPEVPGQWQQFFDICRAIQGFPRHLSIHVGGMLVTGEPLIDMLPVERATMPGRVVVQFNKDDVEDLGLIKMDMLGLRTLSVIEECLELVRTQTGHRPDLDQLDLKDPEVYRIASAADTIGVFQIESRAQMATLPRTRPQTFSDLVVEVAIIRPGPIQGNAVNPYIRRRQGREKVTYPHPKLERILEDTLGVILFQEQILEIVMVLGGYTPAQADGFRRAMSRHRSRTEMEKLRDGFLAAVTRHSGVGDKLGNQIFDSLAGFAEFGFCRSHAAAFARTTYETVWLRSRHPAAYYCGLLNNQPMGFYQPAVLVEDAKRHGLNVLPVDINLSRDRCLPDGEAAFRLGLNYVRGLGPGAIERISRERARGEFADLGDFCRRVCRPLTADELSERDVERYGNVGTSLNQPAPTVVEAQGIENLVLIGAFDAWKIPRRQLAWRVKEAVAEAAAPVLSMATGAMSLPSMSELDISAADYNILSLTTGRHLVSFYRQALDAAGVSDSRKLKLARDGTQIRVAGLVITRQAPGTAKRMRFFTLEDEWGHINLVLTPGFFERHRQVANRNEMLLFDGKVEHADGVISVFATDVRALSAPEAAPTSRDFR